MPNRRDRRTNVRTKRPHSLVIASPEEQQTVDAACDAYHAQHPPPDGWEYANRMHVCLDLQVVAALLDGGTTIIVSRADGRRPNVNDLKEAAQVFLPVAPGMQVEGAEVDARRMLLRVVAQAPREEV